MTEEVAEKDGAQAQGEEKESAPPPHPPEGQQEVVDLSIHQGQGDHIDISTICRATPRDTNPEEVENMEAQGACAVGMQDVT